MCTPPPSLLPLAAMLSAGRLASLLTLFLSLMFHPGNTAAGPAVSAPPPGVELAPRKGNFELLTYNVAGLPEGISRSRPQANLPLIAQLLGRYDVALVQEDFAYPELLRGGLRLPHASPGFV